MKKSVIFIIVCVLAVLGVYISRYLDKPVETKIARITEYEESAVGEAYFVREENVYQAAVSGTFYSYASEGSRVGKDRVIATVYNGVVDAQLLQEISNIDKKIIETEEYLKQNDFVADSANIENRLKNLKNRIIDAAENNRPSELVKIKTDIKSIVSGNTDGFDQVNVAALKNQRQSLEAQLGHSKSDIYSSMSGVFSTNIDGLETVLTPDKIEEYTLADFDAVSESLSEPEQKSAALSGEAVCKVIDNHEWYVMVKTQKEKVEHLKKGQSVLLRFDSIPGVEATAEFLHASEEKGSEDTVAVFGCEQYIEGIFSIRRSSVEIISERYRGFEIPIYALRVDKGKQGVMVQYGVNEIFKPCKVLYTDKEHDTIIIEAITEGVRNPLEQYDKIILGEKYEDAAAGKGKKTDG